MPHAVPHVHENSQNYHEIKCPKYELGPAIISMHSNKKPPPLVCGLTLIKSRLETVGGRTQ